MEAQFENLRSKLIVSCQALEDEPLHSSFIMGRMAKAAYEGGAAGIRANTVEDILEIRKNVSLPIIGIIKEVYDNSEVYITPTLKRGRCIDGDKTRNYCSGCNKAHQTRWNLSERIF